jgi:hypothetical protein
LRAPALKLQMKTVCYCGIAIFLLSTLLGCSDEVRVSDSQLFGTWLTNTNTGAERLAWLPDGTYVQTFTSPKKQFTNRGTWKSSTQFLGGSEIEVSNANISEDEPANSPFRRGDLMLQVYRLDGKLKLARNAAADWYYERE